MVIEYEISNFFMRVFFTHKKKGMQVIKEVIFINRQLNPQKHTNMCSIQTLVTNGNI